MTMPYQPPTEVKTTIGAGTALKCGFFGALGVFLFSLILGAFALVISIVLAVVFDTSLGRLF